MIFQLDNIRYQYPNIAAREKPVFDGLSLEIPGGATTAVVGRSGVGKSTLLYLLGLLWDQPPERGRIMYRGEKDFDYASLSHQDRACLRREQFGFVLQSGYLLPSLTCIENIALPLLLRGIQRRVAYQCVEQIVGQLDDSDDKPLFDRLNYRPYEVSGGERRRMSLLRALVHDPPVVLADEPFSNLNLLVARKTRDFLVNWRQNGVAGQSHSHQRTLLLVTHEIDVAYDAADHFIVFGPDGHVVQGGAMGRKQVDAAGGIKKLHRWIEAND